MTPVWAADCFPRPLLSSTNAAVGSCILRYDMCSVEGRWGGGVVSGQTYASSTWGMRPHAVPLLLLPLLGHTISATAGGTSGVCRDRFLQPFNQTSVWNTAIGSGAVFQAANIFPGTPDLPLPNSFHK